MIPAKNLLITLSFILLFAAAFTGRSSEGEIFKISLRAIFFLAGSIILYTLDYFFSRPRIRKYYPLLLAMTALLLSLIMIMVFPAIKPPAPDPFLSHARKIFDWHSILNIWFPLSLHFGALFSGIHVILSTFNSESSYELPAAALAVTISSWGISRVIPPVDFFILFALLVVFTGLAFLSSLWFLRRKPSKK
ncbi:hypothetical protein KKF34_06440 [Myxococcota bacterium]|nr:hypothetical protein [Myxococcota bacterium]MBU1379849.1 hypothetical protein [Myxococcota bacterium]MBU1496498.1 hypothetical protein [Myxococcota bacterium]